MTTYIEFVPSQVQAPEFQITLDQSVYTGIVTWNLFGQRYYLNLYTLDGTLIVSQPLIGSPVAREIETLVWDTGSAIITTEDRHGYTVGDTLNLTVSGVVPTAYNGRVQVLITGDRSLSYPLAANPGEMTVSGSVGPDINLVAGYFEESTLVYRGPNRQFEVTP